MTNMKTGYLSRTLMTALCLAVAPVAATADESSTGFPTTFIDVYQDGTLFITYEEYLERQRRVEAAQAAALAPRAPAVATPAPARRAPVVAQAARTSNTMSLRNQWTIGAFR